MKRIEKYKAEFKNIEKNRLEELHKTFKMWTLFNKNNIHKYDELLNVVIYVILVNQDILYLCEDYNLEKEGLKKNFYGRMLGMSIYEYLENINFMLGKKFVDELKKHNYDKLIEDVRVINKTYSVIKRYYNDVLKEVRHNASAHKDKDAKKLYKIYTEFPIPDLKDLVYLLSFIESVFFDILTEVYSDDFLLKYNT